MIEEERLQILAEARQQAAESVEAVQEELRKVRKQLRDTSSLNQLKKLSKEVVEIEEEKLLPIAPRQIEVSSQSRKKRQSLQEGDKVLVKSLNVKGEIASISRKEASIAVGRLHMRAQLEDLEFISGPTREEAEADPYVPVSSNASIELDMRGKRVEEGLAEMERHLDQAFLARLPWVRIIHGKGTGRLREAVRKSLKNNRHVSSWEEGKDGEGGAGVTVAKLVDSGS